jgi:hypothetical protein
VEVASAKVSVKKSVYDVAQGKNVTLEAILEPAVAEGQDVWYEWTSACAFGRFNGGNPFRDKSKQLQYQAGSTLEGEDVVTLTAYRVVGDWQTGTRTVLSQAQTRVRVWAVPKKSPMSFYTFGPRVLGHAYQRPGEPLRTSWLVYGWAYSWPTPEGMHKSGSPTVPTTVNITLPYQSRYYDDPYKMGLDLRQVIGIPADANFETRLVAKPISSSTDLNGLKSMIEEANRQVNGTRAGWESAPKPVNIDCVP